MRFVAVDGPAGSGKTTFAGRLANALGARAATVAEIHVDDLLEGWTGLDSFWPRMREQVLEPLSRGADACYQRYDWVRDRFDEEWMALAVPDVLVLEGVSSARGAGDAVRSLGVYVYADRAQRLDRGIRRDGEGLRAQWMRWMTEEDRHFADEATTRRADLLVDGAPTVAHDPEHEYVLLPEML